MGSKVSSRHLRQLRDHEIFTGLTRLYPDARSELNYRTPFELLVAVVLSAQCTDARVNQVTPSFFSEIPSSHHLAAAPLEVVANLLKSINYFRTKAKHLISAAQILVERYDGEIPRTYEELVALPGVGRKTANVVLGELGYAYALPVDTHVFRVSKRLGIATGGDVLAVENSLRRRFEPQSWRALHHGLILHGRRVCSARTPDCDVCPLKRLCAHPGTAK